MQRNQLQTQFVATLACVTLGFCFGLTSALFPPASAGAGFLDVTKIMKCLLYLAASKGVILAAHIHKIKKQIIQTRCIVIVLSIFQVLRSEASQRSQQTRNT